MTRAGETLVKALVAECKSLVLETQKMQNRRVEVVEMDRVSEDVVGEIVGLTVNGAGLRAAPAIHMVK